MKILESGKLHLAAEALTMSQPAASRILSDLEQTFGTPLFERHPTGMIPTEAGQVFARHGQVMLHEMETMGQELSLLAGGLAGHVRVGTVTGPAIGYLMPAVRELLDEAPDLHISVDVAPSNVLFRRLEEGQHDFIIGRTIPGRDKSDYRFHPARYERVAFVVHETHPLAEQDDLSLADAAPYPWVMQEEGSPIRDAVETAFLNRSLPLPKRVLNSSSLLVVLSQLATGPSIAPQTAEVAELLTSRFLAARLVQLPLSSDVQVPPYFIIQNRRRELSSAAQDLLQKVLLRL